MTGIKASFSSVLSGQQFIAVGSFCGCGYIYDTYTGQTRAHLTSGASNLLKVPMWHPEEDRLLFSSKDYLTVFHCDQTKPEAFNCEGHDKLDENLLHARQEMHQMCECAHNEERSHVCSSEF